MLIVWTCNSNDGSPATRYRLSGARGVGISNVDQEARLRPRQTVRLQNTLMVIAPDRLRYGHLSQQLLQFLAATAVATE